MAGLFSSGRIAIGICGRCSKKRPYQKLVSDPNTPGLKVCVDRGCRDKLDPYRLAPRQPDAFILRNPRPDVPLVVVPVVVPAPPFE